MQITWTLEEFQKLKNRLIELDMGYKVAKMNPSEYVIIRENQDFKEILGSYDSNTGELDTYKFLIMK